MKLLNSLSVLAMGFTGIFAVVPFSALADTEAQANFQKGLDYAKSSAAREKFQQALSEFKPQEVLKNKNGGYTDNPPQTGYYSETQSNAYELEKASREEVTKDEGYKDANGNPVPTPGKAVTESFKTRPVFKISQKEEYIKKSNLIETNANNVVMGESNKHIDCEKKKMSACKTIQVEKTCNEEVRTIRRVCEKIPDIQIVDQPYQEIQSYSGSISQADNNSGTFTVPVSGTITSFSASFSSHNVWRCYNNYAGYLQGAFISTYYPGRCEKAPWVHGSLSFGNGNLNVAVSAGTPIRLSFSGDAFGHWHSSHYNLVIRADFKRRVANEPVWRELPCYDL